MSQTRSRDTALGLAKNNIISVRPLQAGAHLPALLSPNPGTAADAPCHGLLKTIPAAKAGPSFHGTNCRGGALAGTAKLQATPVWGCTKLAAAVASLRLPSVQPQQRFQWL